jgi:hypothetical protein
MSYDGTLNFGLLGDFDALPDLDDLAAGAARRDRRARRPRPASGRATARACEAGFLGGLLILALSLAIVHRGRDRAAVARRGQRRQQGRGPGEKVAAKCPDEPEGVTRGLAGR